MPRLEQLKKTQTLSELAVLLGYKPSSLSFVLYKIPDNKKYTSFPIGKKNGGVREIKAPVKRLKHLQKCLAELLTDCDFEISTTLNYKNSLSHGFKKKHSIITNAIKHRNKRHVFNIDLKNFFPSINFGRVRGFFIKNSHFALNPKVATVIAQIACHNNSLPQGSPCSPIISNLIGHLLDMRMVNLAKKTKCTYSRYVDDLTFSTNKKAFPVEIAITKRSSDHLWKAGKELKVEIKNVGFKINKRKTSMQCKTARQVTTGLIVNKKINVKREYYKIARSMCHSLFINDEFYIKKTDPKTGATIHQIGNLNQLQGTLSYIYQVRLSNEKRKDKHFKSRKSVNTFHRTSSTVELYKNFLFYKHFFSLDQPLVVCEGKTDIVYLQCALNQLASKYKGLTGNTKGKISYKIGFLNKSKNFRNVLSIANGSGLLPLMKMYHDQMKTFKGNGKKHPVIILVDDDAGSKGIINELGKRYKKGDMFVHYTDNLYVVFIPAVKGKKVAIEDLFDTKTLETKLNGKKFNRSNDPTPKTEYSKHIFAQKVVKEKQGTINFSKFENLFDSFNKVKKDYAKKIQST